MPLEIKELIVRVTINPPQPQTNAEEVQLSAAQKEAIIESCLKRVRELLDDTPKNDRSLWLR
jgi:hypothetical protein